MQNDNSQAKTVAPTPEYVKEEGKTKDEPDAPKTVNDRQRDAAERRTTK